MSPQIRTVKAPNFGPHGNFGSFFASSVASLDESCTKYEQTQICRSNVFLQLLFSSLFCKMLFNYSRPFWKRGPKFPWGPKLGAFTVSETHCWRAKTWTMDVKMVEVGKWDIWRSAVNLWKLFTLFMWLYQSCIKKDYSRHNNFRKHSSLVTLSKESTFMSYVRNKPNLSGQQGPPWAIDYRCEDIKIVVALKGDINTVVPTSGIPRLYSTFFSLRVGLFFFRR